MMMLALRLPFALFFLNDTATTQIYTLSYTTLFRSHASLGVHRLEQTIGVTEKHVSRAELAPVARIAEVSDRSEEHTSELQSQFHLVCRLLLEKKKPQSSGCSHLAVRRWLNLVRRLV